MAEENTNTNENTPTPEVPAEEVDKVVQDSGEVTQETKKEIVEQVSDKKQEADKVAEESQSLDAENNIPADAITKGEKTLSAIGYISFFCILPLVLKPNSKFCQHHGKQGLVVTLLFILLGFFKFFTIGALLWVIMYLAIIILGIVNSVGGKFWKIPFIYDKISSKLEW